MNYCELLRFWEEPPMFLAEPLELSASPQLKMTFPKEEEEEEEEEEMTNMAHWPA